MTQEELEHYIAKYKEHEARKTSTNERNEYWKKYGANMKSGRNK